MHQEEMKMNKIKQTLVNILDIVGFDKDKEKFAEEFLGLVESEALLDLIEGLPEEDQEKVAKQLSKLEEPQKIGSVVEEWFSPKEVLERLMEVIEKRTKELFEGVKDDITDEQKKELENYAEQVVSEVEASFG